MVAVDLSDFTVGVVTFPFVGTAANAVPAVMNAPTANKAMVFIIPPLLVSPATRQNTETTVQAKCTIQTQRTPKPDKTPYGICRISTRLCALNGNKRGKAL